MTVILKGENTTDINNLPKRFNNESEKWRLFDINSGSEKTVEDHITIFRNVFAGVIDIEGASMQDPILLEKINAFNPDFIVYQNLHEENIEKEIMALRMEIENFFVTIYVPGLVDEYQKNEVEIEAVDYTSNESMPTHDNLCEFVICAAKNDNYLSRPFKKLE
jgi:hypothetical protein